MLYEYKLHSFSSFNWDRHSWQCPVISRHVGLSHGNIKINHPLSDLMPLSNKGPGEWYKCHQILKPDYSQNFHKQVLWKLQSLPKSFAISQGEMRQMSRWEVRKNELTHRMLRVLIRNISNQCTSQCLRQEISLPDILAKAACTCFLSMHRRQVSVMVRRAAREMCPEDEAERIFLNMLPKSNYHS